MKTSASNLKAHLRRFMKAVRAGKDVVVTDRGEPVARIVPFAPTAPQDRAPTERAPEPGAPPLGERRVRSIRYAGPPSTALLTDGR